MITVSSPKKQFCNPKIAHRSITAKRKFRFQKTGLGWFFLNRWSKNFDRWLSQMPKIKCFDVRLENTGTILAKIGKFTLQMIDQLTSFSCIEWGKKLIGGCLKCPKCFLVDSWATFWLLMIDGQVSA